MRTKVISRSPDLALTRLLEALGQELIDAPEEEILQAARDLGLDIKMRGSAAFAGLKYPRQAQLADFFDLDALRALRQRIADSGDARHSSTDEDGGDARRDGDDNTEE